MTGDVPGVVILLTNLVLVLLLKKLVDDVVVWAIFRGAVFQTMEGSRHRPVLYMVKNKISPIFQILVNLMISMNILT